MKLYTATQIARASGIAKRRVLSMLALHASPSGRVVVSGNTADAWEVGALPEDLRAILAGRASQFGFRSIGDLLSNPVEPWQPNWPLSKIVAEHVDYARRLKTTLIELMAGLADLRRDLGELKTRARARYCREFQRPALSERHLNRLAAMVEERDRGFEEWERVEIYLPERYQKASPSACPALAKGMKNLPILADAIDAVRAPEKPTSEDRNMVWRAAVECLCSLTDQGNSEREAKRLIRRFLGTYAAWLAPSEEALKRALNRKLDVVINQGALVDRRKEASGNRRRPDFSEDLLLLTKVAARHDNNIGIAAQRLAVGWTDPRDNRRYQLSQEYRDYYADRIARDRSYVPQWVRDRVRPALAGVNKYRVGPSAAKLGRVSTLRDWSGVGPGDYHQSDDETANSFVYWIDEAGEYEGPDFRFNIGRPQILPLYDLLTDYPLALIVSPTRGYNAETIRELIVPTWLDPRVGMPFKGVYFEQGTWSSRDVKALTEWSRIEAGFASAGITLQDRRAYTPKAKLIERTFGKEQDRTADLPGYVGRGRSKGERYERIDRFLQSLKKVGQPRKEAIDPREQLLSLHEYRDHLVKVMVEMAKTPCHGERHRGRSPEEFWLEGSNHPRHVLPASLAFLLQTVERTRTVTPDGIILKIGNDRYQFAESSRLGMLVGEKVVVRHSGRIPDKIFVTDPVRDPKGLAPFVVPLRSKLPAMDATKDDFRRAKIEADTFHAGQRALYKLIAPARNLTIQRETIGSTELREHGAAIERARQEAEAEATQRRSITPRVRQLAREVGLAGDSVRPTAEAIDELVGIQDLKAELAAREAIEEIDDL